MLFREDCVSYADNMTASAVRCRELEIAVVVKGGREGE